MLYHMIELCIDHILFTHSFINGHSRCFLLLAVVNSATVKTLGTNISSRPCFQFVWLDIQKWDFWNMWLLLFSCSIMSDSLWPRGLQHARLPCPSPSPRACSNSCPLSWWCHPTISSSVVPFSSCLQSFPVSGSFLMSRLFTSGGQSIGASASVLPMNIQGWFPLGWIGLISFQSKGLSRVFSNTAVWKHKFFGARPSLWSNSHICTWLLEKP